MGKRTNKMGFKVKKTAWLFPGQGSQKVGMGLDLMEKSEKAKKYFDISNEIMDCDIQSIIFNGPEEKLKRTEYTQPGMYIVSVILGYLIIDRGLRPNVLAGHSLGEYSALTVGGAFDFITGLRLVKMRSESMAMAGKNEKGTMAAIIGLNEQKIEKLCKSYNGEGVLVIANYNSPTQIVISGTEAAIEWGMVKAKNIGARIATKLKVSGAFHSPLMAPATENLAEMIKSLEISHSSYPVYTNVDGKPVKKNIDIKDSLIRQIENPVRWTNTILSIKASGILNYLEIGSGKVLQNLNKRIDKSLNTKGVESIEQLEKIYV